MSTPHGRDTAPIAFRVKTAGFGQTFPPGSPDPIVADSGDVLVELGDGAIVVLITPERAKAWGRALTIAARIGRRNRRRGV